MQRIKKKRAHHQKATISKTQTASDSRTKGPISKSQQEKINELVTEPYQPMSVSELNLDFNSNQLKKFTYKETGNLNTH